MDPFAPVDLSAGDLQLSTAPQPELVAWGMGSHVTVQIRWGAHIIASGAGATLGEALMVAGALLTRTPIVPMHRRVLTFLRRRR